MSLFKSFWKGHRFVSDFHGFSFVEESLKILILDVMSFFCKESINCFFFRVDRVNSKYRSSHPSPTDSRLSLGINCIWYQTHRGRCWDGYDSTKSYRTRPIFWTLIQTPPGFSTNATNFHQPLPICITINPLSSCYSLHSPHDLTQLATNSHTVTT